MPALIDPSTIEAAPSRIPATTDWLRANVEWDKPLGADPKSNVIRGMVAAELGPFKSEGRGEFDDQSLDTIVRLANQGDVGLKSRFTHPGLSSDGLGTALGRAKNWRRDGGKVRYDLHFNKTAMAPPPGGGTPYGQYVMDLASSDAGLFGSSLVLKVDKEFRREKDGTLTRGPDGEPLPPLWRPIELRAIDVVDDGDAVHGAALSVEGLADQNVRLAAQVLDAQFTGCDRPAVRARAEAFLSRYLDQRFGDEEMAAPEPTPTPKPPTPPQPDPAPPKPPTQPREHHGELSAEAREALKAEVLAEVIAGVKHELGADREDLRKQVESAKAEQVKQLAAAKVARIDSFLAANADRIRPAELDESDPETAHKSLRQRLLRLSTDETIAVGEKKLSPLDVELETIADRPLLPQGEKLRSQAKVDSERVKKLRAHYPLLTSTN